MTLPEYPDSFTVNITEAAVSLSPDGSADIIIYEDYHYHRYITMKPIATLGDNDLRKVMFSIYHLPQTEIDSIEVGDNCKPYGVPSLTYLLKAHSQKYASVTGSRMFVPTNLLHKNYMAAADSHLANELFVSHGLRNVEMIVFAIPEGYAVESIPEGTSLSLPFANFSSSVSAEGNTIIITYDYSIQHGTFPGMAEQFNDFEKRVGEAYARKIVLKK